MNGTNKRWLVFCAVAGIGLVIAVVAISGSSASPRTFLRDTYSCQPDPTNNDSATCTANQSPSTVATAIADDTRPVDHGSHDGMEFMQYEDDIVAVSADGNGSKITVEDYETGYHHYHSYFAFFGWTSYRPGSSGFGGGGFGGGGK